GRFRLDQPAALEHERYRRFGHARLAGNVEYRRLGPAGHSFQSHYPYWINWNVLIPKCTERQDRSENAAAPRNSSKYCIRSATATTLQRQLASFVTLIFWNVPFTSPRREMSDESCPA